MLHRIALLFFVFAYLTSSNRIKAEVFSTSLKPISQAAESIADSYYKMGWFSGSLLMTKDNEVFFEKSYGYANLTSNNKNALNTKFNLGSIIKDFTKVLVLQQVEKGILSLDDTLDKFELGFPRLVSSKITVEQLVNHTSGFDDIFNAEYRENRLSFNTLEKKLKLLINQPLLFEPGSERRYSNYGYIVLGAILEKVTNQTFEQLLRIGIFRRVGLNNTTFKVTPEKKEQSVRYTYRYDDSTYEVGVTEHPGPDGGIESTTTDVQKFYRELFYGNKLLNLSNAIVRKAFAMDGEHWRSYGGGQGVSAAVEVNLMNGIEIVVLANTDSLIAELISGRIQSFIQTGKFDEIKVRSTNFAYQTYLEKGKDAFYKGFKEEYSKHGYNQFIGRTINELGMQLLEAKSWDESLDIFNYLVFIFPNAPQAYDSLSFAYFSIGDIGKAKETFKKALAIKADFNSDYVGNNYGIK